MPRSFTKDKHHPKFEIWFAVVICKSIKKSLWIRYTKMQSQALVWGSLFDSNNQTNHCFGVSTFSLSDVNIQKDQVQYPNAILTPDKLSGQVSTLKGNLEWDIDLSHRYDSFSVMPDWLNQTNIPKTKSIICSPFASASGQIKLEEEKYNLSHSDAILNHIWGKQRIDELTWTFVPAFDNDPEGWHLEIISVRIYQRLPPLLFFSIHGPNNTAYTHSFWQSISSKIDLAYPTIHYHVKSKDFELLIDSTLHIEQTTPYIYRDSDGSRRYIEQSDIGCVNCIIKIKNREVRLTCNNAAAVEFHGLLPWSKKSYIDPYLSN